jgi:hypothetical protein
MGKTTTPKLNGRIYGSGTNVRLVRNIKLNELI